MANFSINKGLTETDNLLFRKILQGEKSGIAENGKNFYLNIFSSLLEGKEEEFYSLQKLKAKASHQMYHQAGLYFYEARIRLEDDVADSYLKQLNAIFVLLRDKIRKSLKADKKLPSGKIFDPYLSMICINSLSRGIKESLNRLTDTNSIYGRSSRYQDVVACKTYGSYIRGLQEFITTNQEFKDEVINECKKYDDNEFITSFITVLKG